MNNTRSLTSFSYITHLECTICKKEYSSNELNTYCHDCNTPLLANYDLDGIRQNVRREGFSKRPKGMWRWHELLPVRSEFYCTTLGEGDSKLFRLSHLGEQLGLSNLFIKDESSVPTGSYKARGIAAAISKAKELGIKKVTIPTSGDAGGTVAKYAARAGIKAYIFMPKNTPAKFVDECRMASAEVILVDGLIDETPGKTSENASAAGWFDLSTFKEPYRVEGKKVIGYELAEAFGWTLPDVIICAVGGGAGLVGLWKAFRELTALGWLENGKLPRLIAVQSKGCAPLVKAFGSRASFSDFWTNAHSVAPGLCIPKSFADHLVLHDLYESNGLAISVIDEAILAAQQQLLEVEKISSSLEGAATAAALAKLVREKCVHPEERIVLLNTGSGQKNTQTTAKIVK